MPAASIFGYILTIFCYMLTIFGYFLTIFGYFLTIFVFYFIFVSDNRAGGHFGGILFN